MDLYEAIVGRLNFWTYVILMMIGLYAMIAKKNLIKKLIGMGIFQSAVILFYVSISVKEGATIPIIAHHTDHAPKVEQHSTTVGEVVVVDKKHATVDPDTIANPLPHVLMLTAIVVGVATLGVGLALVQKIHRDYGTIEEDELLEKIRSDESEDEDLAHNLNETATAPGDG
jgi:multicomponent Na+:H+ antiporter subunit C